MLTGEPGIGKSHIALALDERLENEPHITIRQFCSAHHTNSALYPFIRQLERAARFERGDAPAEKFAKLEALLVRSRADPDRIVVPLANLLSIPPSDRYRLPELSPQKRKEVTLAAFLAQFSGLAARAAVVRHCRGCPLGGSDVAGAAHDGPGAAIAASGATAASPRGRNSRRPGRVMRM